MNRQGKSQHRTNVTAEQVGLFVETFVSRWKPFPVQKPDGSYLHVHRRLNEQDIYNHLLGRLTIGLLPGEDGSTKLGVVDIDLPTPDAVAAVRKRCAEFAMPFITVYSGSKGYHVTTFFEHPTPISKARAVMMLVAGEHEVWPKQTHVAPGRLGNCIKAPFGIHRKSGNWCVAVDEGFELIEDHWQLVREVARTNADRILAQAFMQTQGGQKRPSGGESPLQTPKDIKPCLEEHRECGTDQGLRNTVGFALATEMRRVGLGDDKAIALLEDWNTRNRPPLGRRDVDSLMRSAYGREKSYEYGCSGPLTQFVACVGKSKCSYYQQLRHRARGGSEHHVSQKQRLCGGSGTHEEAQRKSQWKP